MFALFALAGDIGCAVGPDFVGIVSEISEGGLKSGILWAAVFPLAAILVTLFLKFSTDRRSNIK